MRRMAGQIFRNVFLPMVGVVTAGALVAGCGDKAKDPDAVTVDELKYPGHLVIQDNGNGEAVLWWTASNNEDDFDGYNVYGAKAKTGAPSTDLGVTPGDPIQLLDDKGEPVTKAKEILQKFDYDPADGKKLEGKGLMAMLEDAADDAAAEEEGGGEAEFSFLPIHTLDADGETALLPTCKIDGSACKMTTAANADKAVSDDVNFAANGKVSFALTDSGNTLVVGNTYCFLVMSSMSAGEKVSQTSSNVACINPKYKQAFNLPMPGGSTVNQKFDLTTWLAACVAAGSCSDPVSGDTAYVGDDSATHTAADAGPLYIEDGGAQGPQFVAGAGSGIIDLGYYANGFADATLPAMAPVLTIDSNELNGAPILNGGGYSLAGQSVPVTAKHVYVVAVSGETAGKVHYYWLSVGDTVEGGTPAAVEVRMSKADE